MDDAGLTQGLSIRRARPEELDACAALYVRVLTETFTWLPPERHKAADFLRATRSEEIYVAIEAGKIVGVAGFFRPQNFIHSLYVTERGRGIGRALLGHLARVADGPLSLKCQAANVQALAFYKREGFHCTGRGEDGEIDWVRLSRG